MNNRGSVMIFVLIVITFCVAVAMLVNENATDDFLRSHGLKNYYQSTIYAATAVKGIREILQDDSDFRVDSREDDWINIPTIPLDDGFINIIAYPLNSRISLAGLLSSDNSTKNRTQVALAEFFDSNEITEYNPDVIKDWMDTDTDVSDNGIEDFTYEKKGVSFTTRNLPLSTLLELSYFMDDQVFTKIKSTFNPIEKSKYLNLNFVDRDTLVMYLPELEPYADDIILYRENNIYTDKSQILKASPAVGSVYTVVDDFIGVKSAFIYALIEVNINDVSRYYHALIERRSNKKANLITFFEGGNELYY